MVLYKPVGDLIRMNTPQQMPQIELEEEVIQQSSSVILLYSGKQSFYLHTSD